MIIYESEAYNEIQNYRHQFLTFTLLVITFLIEVMKEPQKIKPEREKNLITLHSQKACVLLNIKTASSYLMKSIF